MKEQQKIKDLKHEKKRVECWQALNCEEKECPVYIMKDDYRCWLFSGTHCRKEIQKGFLEKMEMCINCKVFRLNMDPSAMRKTMKIVNQQFKEYREAIEEREEELKNISTELAIGLSESFEGLKKISSGDPTIRIPEQSGVELISKLKHLVNITAGEIGEIVNQSHEIAIGLAEHFDVLHRVSKGDLDARVTGSSTIELLESLKKVMNEMIQSISAEIGKRETAETELRKAHDKLEHRVEARTTELRVINEKLWREIVQRKRIEEELREAELRYRTVADFTHDWEYWENPDGKLSYVSPSCERITGYKAEQFIENPDLISDITLPEDRGILINHRHAALQKPGRQIIEFRIRRHDGKICWIEHVCQPVTGLQGEFLGVRASNRDITIRKEAEDSLRNTLSLLNATLESTADGILVVDKTGKISSFNKKFVQMWNIPEPVIESRNDDETLTFVLNQLNEPERFLSKVKELYTHPEVESYDIVQFKDGRVFERYSQPQRIGEAIIGRVWSFRDITERTRAEDTIRESEEKYRQLFIAETDAIIVFDAQTENLVDVNNAALNIYGYTYEDFLKMKRKDISLDPSVFEKSLKTVLSGKSIEIPLLYHKKKDGTIFPVEMCASSFTAGGRKMVFEVVKDITERKRAQDRLRESEEKFRAIADYTHDWESWIGQDGRLIWVNAAVERITGYSPEECLTMEDYPLPLIVPEDREHMAKAFESALHQQSATDVEFRVNSKDGAVIWVSISWQSIYDDAGNWTGYRTSARDITVRKDAEEELKVSHANLRALSVYITEIEEAERLRLSRELHDQVGQKLTALNMNLEFLIKQLSQEATESTVSRLDDSKGLVKEVMKLVRHIMTDLRPRILDDYGLKATLHWYCDQFTKRFNIPVIIKGDELEPRLPLDVETNLFRIVQESLTNIVKHAHAHKVAITLKEQGGKINISITDNGIGFDPSITHQPGETKGLGLIGMKERAESIHGRLRVDSSPGKGTRITIKVER